MWELREKVGEVLFGFMLRLTLKVTGCLIFSLQNMIALS